MRLTITICLLLLCGKLFAQQNNFAPAKLLTSFKFEQLTGGVIILQATLNHLPDTLHFLFDTGSGGISLDTFTALHYQLPLVPSDRTVRGIGGIKPIHYYKNGTLHFPGLDVENLDFHINDYEILSSVYGIRIDGIIGFSFLRRYIVALDYDKQIISVYQPGTFNYPKKGVFLQPTFTSIPVTEHYVQDEKSYLQNFFFDTGAGLCLLLNEKFIQDSGFLSKNKKSVNTQVEGLIGKISMQLTTIKQIRIGKYKFTKVPIHVYNDSLNVLGYPFIAGLLGSDLLRRFNLVLNYPERTIHLTPNTHIREAFDYSYTGMNYYFIDGKIIITEIQQGSPAEKAGLMPGDVIFGIENNFSNNINQYKLLLQHPGQKVRILIFRNAVPKMMEIKVGSILK